MATIIGSAGSMSGAADRPALNYYIIFPNLSSSSPKSESKGPISKRTYPSSWKKSGQFTWSLECRRCNILQNSNSRLCGYRVILKGTKVVHIMNTVVLNIPTPVRTTSCLPRALPKSCLYNGGSCPDNLIFCQNNHLSSQTWTPDFVDGGHFDRENNIWRVKYFANVVIH